jgi:pantoate--beta-alanine ligase
MSSIIRITKAEEWSQLCKALRVQTGSLGLVPTMGALHERHLSLVRRSRKENGATVVSIFVNPTQFDDPDDLAVYPQPLEHDLAVLEQEGADAVFLPTRQVLYPDDYTYRVSETALSRELCGAYRPGHFDGVLTVVLKLLLLTGADRAYFGEKDYQQYLLVEGLVRAFFLETQIVSCPLVREADGLALSSRNVRLTPQGRSKAPLLYRILRQYADPVEARRALMESGFTVDYVEDRQDLGDGRRLAAVHLDGVRLIDNVPLSEIGTGIGK